MAGPFGELGLFLGGATLEYQEAGFDDPQKYFGFFT